MLYSPKVWELERFQTAKVTSEVTQGHWCWCHSTNCTKFSISLLLQLCLYLEQFLNTRLLSDISKNLTSPHPRQQLHPRYCHLANSTKHNLVFWFCSTGTIMWNVTSYTKLEVRNILHCCQRRTEPRPHITFAKNFVKFLHVVFELCEFTDR